MPNDNRNVFVGISVRNKTLTPQQVEEIVRRAQAEFKARRLLFLIADELEIINLRVFETGMAETLVRHVAQRCDDLERVVEQGVASVRTNRLYITTDRWQSILNTEYWESYITVFSRFVESEAFRVDVESVARRFAERRGATVTPEQLHYLSLYLLAEMPTLLSGVRHKQRRYLGMIYPARRDEAIDGIAAALAEGKYGQVPGLSQACRIVRMDAE
jgi:tRNA-dependent cyclodipeptide synthase